MRILLLGGGGRMARATILDFLRFDSDELTELVISDLSLERALQTIEGFADSRLSAVAADIRDVEATTELMSRFDVVISSTVSFGDIPLLVVQEGLAAGVHLVEVGGFFPADADTRDSLNEGFERAGRTALLGMGSSPGIMSVLARAIADRMDRVESFHLSFAYASAGTSTVPFKVPFAGALNEFVMEPVVYVDGEFKKLAPLSGIEDITYPDPIGTRRSFLVLHPEILTFPESFKHKGLRNLEFRAGFTAEFFEQCLVLRSAGLLSLKSIEVDGAKMAPLDMVAKCAENMPAEQGDVQDYGISRIIGRGMRGNERLQITGTMMSYPYWGLTSAQHRTGHSPAIGARMIMRGDITKRGLFPPETGVDPSIFFKEIARRELEVWFDERIYA
jgi:lysine 6-dehydrogenase